MRIQDFQKNRRSLAVASVALVTAVIWLHALLPSAKTLDLTVLDVGEGLCAVLRSPTGRILVLDCGTSSWRKSSTVGDRLVAPYLQSMGIQAIDVAVLSHPHSDHMSGYAALLKKIPARLVLDIAAKDRSPYYSRFLQAVRRSHAVYRTARRGQEIDLGGGAIAQVLSPDPSSHYTDLNDRSIVLRVVFEDTTFLLAADAGDEAERRMMGSRTNLRSQVLLVGHHGSEYASSIAWLSAIQPRVAIISCGRRNQFGHPSAVILARLKASGTQVYRTDRDGAVCLSTDGHTIRVRAFRRTP